MDSKNAQFCRKVSGLQNFATIYFTILQSQLCFAIHFFKMDDIN